MRSIARTPIFRGWWIVATGYLAQLATIGSTGFVFGVLILPMQQELAWSRSEIVGVVTLARLLGGLVAMRAGPLADRYGARWLITLSALGAAACMLGTSLVQSQLAYYLCWAVFGLTIPGLSTVGPAVAVSNWFVRRRTQAVMVLTFGSATAGLVLAPVMAAIANADSWRTSWLVMALIFLLVAPLAWTFVRRRPEDVGLHPDGIAPDSIEAQTSDNQMKPEPESAWTVRSALRSRSFWLLTIAFMLTSFPAASIFLHMASFVESKGFSPGAGAAAVSVYGAGVLLGRFVWGFVVSKVGVYRALVAYGFGYGLSIFLFVLPQDLPLIYATTALLGIGIAGAQQLNVQAFPDYFGRRIVGSLYGYASVVASTTGATAPLIAAAAFDHSNSYSAIFLLFGSFCLVAGVCFLFSKPRVPSTKEQAPRTEG